MHKLRNLKHIFAIIGIVLLFAFGSTFLKADFFDSINSFFVYRTGSGAVFQDFIHEHSLKPSVEKIAIIDINDATLNALQAKGNLKMLRIPKSVYTAVVERLESVGVKGIAFDIVFQNADPGEELFAKTLSKYPNIVLAAEYHDTTFYDQYPCEVDSGTGGIITCVGIPRSIYAGTSWGLVNNISSMLGIAQADISNLPYAVWKVGKNGRGTTKTFLIKPLAFSLFEQTGGGTGTYYPMTSRKGSDGKEEQVISNPYFGEAGTYPRIGLEKILEMSKLDLVATFGGRYVFIGESGTAIHDSILSPVTGSLMDGVELHANFLDGLLQNKMLKMVDTNIFFIIILILTIASTILYFFIDKLLSPIIAIAVSIAIVWVYRYLYDDWRMLLDIFPIFIAGVFSYIVTYMYKFFVIDREKRELQANFGHYIDPLVVKKIVDQGDPIELGGEKRNLSILFSDIAGFTTLSEKLSPQDLFYLMTSYLSNMTDILIREGGTLDKYIGDAVMGFFGAPLPYTDHAIRACRTALLMRVRLPVFNDDIVAHGLEPIDFRVGIASGEVMVGNIGSHDRFNYTVLGDTVNLASRLEGTGKEYGISIIISASVRVQLPEEYFVRELDTIAVKGKTEGVRIYELVDFSKNIDSVVLYEDYEKALHLYREEKYREAGEIWANHMETDNPSRVMADRCAAILNHEVVVEDGTFHMLHK